MRILFVTPHLSTGGLPEYLRWKISILSKTHIIEVVEYQNLSDIYTVQKTAIKSMCPIHTLGEDKSELLKVIDKFRPNIIHFEENPESFVPSEILSTIYASDQAFKILETSHDSRFNASGKRFLPHGFVFPCQGMKSTQNIPAEVWEIPINQRFGKDRRFKVLNVGLFTPGKNQGQLFQIAENIKEVDGVEISYHFAGNMADNFRSYWEPLVSNKQDNITLWGELDLGALHTLYAASDLLYFPSLSELNPLVVKEALYYNIPVFMYNLPIYKGKYDNYPGVYYIGEHHWTKVASAIIRNNKVHNLDYSFIAGSKPSIPTPVPIPVINQRPDSEYQASFIDGARLSIEGSVDTLSPPVSVEFCVGYGVVHRDNIRPGMWTKAFRCYHQPWIIKANNKVVHEFNAKDKRVFISFESSALGDTVAWFPYVEEFRKKHDCKVIVSTFHNDLFELIYPQIEFVAPGTTVHDLYAMYRLGIFYNGNQIDVNKHPLNPLKQPLQKAASDILGLEYQEIRPMLDHGRNGTGGISAKNKVVCIGMESTAQAKYWNNDGGWLRVINHLHSRGYEVKVISKSFDKPEWMPSHVTWIGNNNIQQVMRDILYSDLFIGLGSGLSWLAWALETPVILISGFSEPYTEMQSGVTRISAPAGACRGCFNKYPFDKGDWNWCPEHKGTDRQFECTKLITPETIIEAINKVLI